MLVEYIESQLIEYLDYNKYYDTLNRFEYERKKNKKMRLSYEDSKQYIENIDLKMIKDLPRVYKIYNFFLNNRTDYENPKDKQLDYKTKYMSIVNICKGLFSNCLQLFDKINKLSEANKLPKQDRLAPDFASALKMQLSKYHDMIMALINSNENNDMYDQYRNEVDTTWVKEWQSDFLHYAKQPHDKEAVIKVWKALTKIRVDGFDILKEKRDIYMKMLIHYDVLDTKENVPSQLLLLKNNGIKQSIAAVLSMLSSYKEGQDYVLQDKNILRSISKLLKNNQNQEYKLVWYRFLVGTLQRLTYAHLFVDGEEYRSKEVQEILSYDIITTCLQNLNGVFGDSHKREDKSYCYLTDHTLSLLCNIVMDSTAIEWFLKNKNVLKEMTGVLVGLMNLTKVDAHTLILSVVVVNQLYRHERLKEYLDTIGVPEKVSAFVEAVSSMDMSQGQAQTDEKLGVAASERKTLLDLCAQIFHSMEYDEEDNEYNESKCFYALRNMRGWQGEGPIVFDYFYDEVDFK